MHCFSFHLKFFAHLQQPSQQNSSHLRTDFQLLLRSFWEQPSRDSLGKKLISWGKVLNDVWKIRSYLRRRASFWRGWGVNLNRNMLGPIRKVCAELPSRRWSFQLRGFWFVKRKFLGKGGSFAEFHGTFTLPRLVLHIKSVIFQIHADVINLSLVLLLLYF